jgi:hypothetical protein
LLKLNRQKDGGWAKKLGIGKRIGRVCVRGVLRRIVEPVSVGIGRIGGRSERRLLDDSDPIEPVARRQRVEFGGVGGQGGYVSGHGIPIRGAQVRVELQPISGV